MIVCYCNQNFRQGLKDVAAKQKACSKRSNTESLVFVKESASAIGIPDTSNVGPVISAGHGANEASKSKEVLKMEIKLEIGLNMVSKKETLCFYEVRCKLRF